MILVLVSAFVTASVPVRPPVVVSYAGKGPGHATKHVVALGDSVTSGTGCRCVPFPRLYGSEIARISGWPISVENLGKGGMDSADLLDQLNDRRSRTSKAVAGADIVLVTIGANDFSPDQDSVTRGDCLKDSKTECTEDELAQLRKNMATILVRIRQLRGDQRTSVLVTGYWSVFESGDVARSRYPKAGINATRKLTLQVNKILRAATNISAFTYVDLLAPFNGPASKGDITTLLAPDGDHPNAAGHSLIAQQLIVAGLRGLIGDSPTLGK